MVIALVLVTIVAFIIVDLLIRYIHGRVKEARVLKEREAALDIGLRLDYREDSPSLKRVGVPEPRARILAVDDEAIVLDSFRKILVLGGYSVDTVETGHEAIGLLRAGEYDFLFTDLKMPEMDGVEVVKAANHLRPDVDIVVITGFATIESAVETMKHGATDYVQKPFTADELLDFVSASLIRRQNRLERALRPHVRLVTASHPASPSPREFNVPAGLFVSPQHAWAGLFANGLLQVGADDFAQKVFGPVDDVELPETGTRVQRGDVLFALVRDGHRVAFTAPASGRILAVNEELLHHPSLVNAKPYETGWICWMEPDDLSNDLKELRVASEVVDWYEQEIDRHQEVLRELGVEEVPNPPDDGGTANEEALWKAIDQTLRPA